MVLWPPGLTLELDQTARAAQPHIPEDPLGTHHEIGYASEKPPVFLGHCWLEGSPKPLARNIACLDYSVAKPGGRLVACRWRGGRRSTRMNSSPWSGDQHKICLLTLRYDTRTSHLPGELGLNLKKLALTAEVVASLGVIITLVLLLLEVRENTMTMERQTETAHFNLLFTSLIEPSILRSAYTKIKAVDGAETTVAAFMATYDMSEAEAVVWSRYQLMLWGGMQLNFVYDGPSDRLAKEIRQLLQFPDIVLFLEQNTLSEEFMSYIESVKIDPELQ